MSKKTEPKAPPKTRIREAWAPRDDKHRVIGQDAGEPTPKDADDGKED